MNYLQALTEAGIYVDKSSFVFLSEASQLKVTDETLSQLFKFITDKYNSLDFSEIEKSAGDIHRFKYYELIRENNKTLKNIYESSTDPGAAKYLEVVKAIDRVMNYLSDNHNILSTLYKSGNGVVQLLYTSMVAACLYSIGILVSNTIRFVTVETETDCQVMFDEIPGSIKHVHIKNIMAIYNDIPSVDKVIREFSKMKNNQALMSESITVSGGVVAALVVSGIIILIPRIVVLIREIIYSIYYTRVKISDMLDMQVQLIRTNIESLEAGRGNKKVVARQRKIADKLEIWKNRVAIRMDTAEVAIKQQKMKENKTLDLDHNSPIIQAEMTGADTGTLLI